MSTWSEAAGSTPSGVELFLYPTAGGLQTSAPTSTAASVDHFEEALEHARQQGRREGEAAARKSLESTLHSERGALAEAVRRLDQERSSFAKRLEPEVVRLALAIAKKILQREAQVDPLVLAAVVRSALDRLDSSTTIKLYVSASHLEDWRSAIKNSARASVQFLPDPQLSPTACRIETEIGSTDISIDEPLKEIEQRFMDLLAHHSGGELYQ